MLRPSYKYVTGLIAGLLAVASIASSSLAAFAPRDTSHYTGATTRESAVAPHVRSELVSEQATVIPGETFYAGLLLNLEDGWHVYWHNPGDSGEPPKIQWVLPAGFSAGKIQWPKPSKLPVSPLMNYGYEEQVLLMAPIQVPTTLKPGEPVELKATARWLVCKDVCVPGRAELHLQLWASSGHPKMDPKMRPIFESTRRAFPQPLPKGWTAETRSDGNHFVLSVNADKKLSGAVFFPAEAEQIENAAAQTVMTSEAGAKLKLKKSDQLSAPIQNLNGVLEVGRQAYEIQAPVSGVQTSSESSSSSSVSTSTWAMLFFAFLGGLILNLMPCVFPILSIKILGFVRSSHEHRSELRVHGLAYAAGVVLSFWALVAMLIVLRSAGQQVGWGFQLQSPTFVACLAVFFFLVGLNLLGVFEFGGSAVGIGQKLVNQGGASGSFFTGVLATIVATPCSAPFMGTAVGFALSQSTVIAFLVFTSLALGLAAPYVLLSFWPNIGAGLPKPGRWMETFKQAMAFPLFATVIWLAWVLSLQAGPGSILKILSALLISGMAAWVLGRWHGRKIFVSIGLALIVAAFAIAIQGAGQKPDALADATSTTKGSVQADGKVHWEPFSEERIARYSKENLPVFVDFTAAWCVTCQVNEVVVLHSKEILDLLREMGVVMMKADWTSYDPKITQALSGFGRSGVPLYVLYPGIQGSAPRVLPEVVSTGLVLDELQKLQKERKK